MGAVARRTALRAMAGAGVRIGSVLALACAREPTSDGDLWRLAATEMASRRSDWGRWESVAVDSIGVAQQVMASTLDISVVERPSDHPVPCAVQEVADGIPDVSLYLDLIRSGPDSAIVIAIVACEYHDGVRVRSSRSLFTLHLARGRFRWVVRSVTEE